MRVTYDSEADAAYLYVVDRAARGPVKRTSACEVDEIAGQVFVDWDDEGHLLGIEILDAGRVLPEQLLALADPAGQ